MSSEFDHWPTCAACSERAHGRVVVEEYEVDPGLEGRLTVIARCSHGRGFKAEHVHEQRCVITPPEWWGLAHRDDAIRGLIFFIPGTGPVIEHGMVTQVN